MGWGKNKYRYPQLNEVGKKYEFTLKIFLMFKFFETIKEKLQLAKYTSKPKILTQLN